MSNNDEEPWVEGCDENAEASIRAEYTEKARLSKADEAFLGALQDEEELDIEEQRVQELKWRAYRLGGPKRPVEVMDEDSSTSDEWGGVEESKEGGMESDFSTPPGQVVLRDSPGRTPGYGLGVGLFPGFPRRALADRGSGRFNPSSRRMLNFDSPGY